MTFAPPTSVLITGGGGDLGRKLTHHLLGTDWCRRIVSVDLRPPTDIADPRVVCVEADLLDRGAPWWAAMGEAEAAVHLAAQNPHTDATWADSAASFDMTQNVADAAVAHGLKRLVFASSNHVMGGYKDAPLASPEPGFLTDRLPHSPGTKWDTGSGWMDSTAYAVAKMMGERVLVGAAARAAGTLSTVSVRIGWVQPGANRPETINVSGDVAFEPGPEPEDADGKRDLLWYRNMWLSNGDFVRLFEATLRTDPAGWPAPSIVVNGVSNNAGTGWDLGFAKETLGYAPVDDLFATVGR